MAIYTMWGNEVKIIAANAEKTMVNIRFVDDGLVDTRAITELKADDGITEIMAAIEGVVI